jgi:hypothetical protein
MTSTSQHHSCISKIHCCAASVALALAFALVLAVAATPSAQAQTYSEKVTLQLRRVSGRFISRGL